MNSLTRDAGTGSGATMPLADRYRVLARVGVGGTAIVYRCVDLHTDRIVAVKVLRTTGPLIPEAAARFRREAHLASSLTHPHIARVLDYGYTVPLASPSRAPWQEDSDKPVPYLAMEYVFGSTLKELLRRRGPLPFDWVWRLGEQLCSALAAAHAMGVVHRDVKPQNVMLVDSKLELLSKLADFGIARQVGGDLTTLTVTGQVLGTPDYLSPEQVLGEPGGPAADLYSLGIVLYELSTGRLPFEADTPLAAASRRMVADPPPPSAYRQDFPRPLQDVVLLALRRQADERYADALEFAQALRWSRERSPAVPSPARGSWLVPRGAKPTQPPPQQARQAPPPHGSVHGPASIALDTNIQEWERQSTVLRVAPAAPGIETIMPGPRASSAHDTPAQGAAGVDGRMSDASSDALPAPSNDGEQPSGTASS